MADMGGHGPILLSPLPLISGPQWPAGRTWVERGDPPTPQGPLCSSAVLPSAPVTEQMRKKLGSGWKKLNR